MKQVLFIIIPILQMRKVKHRERFSGSPKTTEHGGRARTHIQVV